MSGRRLWDGDSLPVAESWSSWLREVDDLLLLLSDISFDPLLFLECLDEVFSDFSLLEDSMENISAFVEQRLEDLGTSGKSLAGELPCRLPLRLESTCHRNIKS
ncbi:hypothetical protein QQ045_023115 [Rhodiola kirilowii]